MQGIDGERQWQLFEDVLPLVEHYLVEPNSLGHPPGYNEEDDAEYYDAEVYDGEEDDDDEEEGDEEEGEDDVDTDDVDADDEDSGEDAADDTSAADPQAARLGAAPGISTGEHFGTSHSSGVEDKSWSWRYNRCLN